MKKKLRNSRDEVPKEREVGKIAVVVIALALFMVVAYADIIIISIDYTSPTTAIVGVIENTDFAYAAQTGNNWTVWYNNASAGSFGVVANAQDGESGIVNMTWPATLSAGGTNETASSFDINFTWSYNWDTANSSNFYGQYVTVYDNASNTNTSSNFFNIIWDNIAPNTTDNGPTDNITYYTSPVTITLTAVENVNGSGINFTRFCFYSADSSPCDPASGNVSYANPTTVVLSCSFVCRFYVLYFSGDNVGNNETIKSTNRINIEIGPFNLPTISGIECANETGVYGSCDNIGYGETLWKVRANVTKGDFDISNVVFKLVNIDDNGTLFNSAYNENNDGEYRFVWNHNLTDSGTFNLTVTAIDTMANSSSASYSWSVPFGAVNITTSPSSDINVTKNQTFTLNATYSCTGGECGDIAANLTFNNSLFSISPGSVVNSSTVSCLADMLGGDICTVVWTVTVTGNKTQGSEFSAGGSPTEYALNVSAAGTTPFNITIINSAPTVPVLLYPGDGSTVNNLTIPFDWQNSSDIDGDAFNYTLQADNDSDFSSPEVDTNVTDSNFTTALPSTGIWYWRVRAYDADASAWASRFFVVGTPGVVDNTPPLVILSSPANGASVVSGNVTLIYTPYDSISGIANCSLYIDTTLNATTSSVTNGVENNFTFVEPSETNHTWTVSCTDTSDNVGNSSVRSVRTDNSAPSANWMSVIYQFGWSKTKEGFGILVDVSAGDTVSGVSSIIINCTALGSGLVDTTLQNGSSADGVWRASCAVIGTTDGFEGNVTVYAIVTDGVGFTSIGNVTVVLDNKAPDNPAYINVSNSPADTDGVIDLTWPASASADAAQYNVYRSNIANFVPAPGLQIGSTPNTTWTDVPPKDGTWYWKVTAVDDVDNENLTNAPENSTLVDTGAPSIENLTLTYPLLAANPAFRQTHVKNGDSLMITVNATDPQNISAVWVDVSAISVSGNVTMTFNLTGDGTYGYNVTIGGTAGDSNQTIRIYANDTSGNTRNGVAARVAIDNSNPTVAIADDGNFTSLTTLVHAGWNYSDSGSDALVYVYTVYDNLGGTAIDWTWTTSTDVIKTVSPPLSEGLTYFWFIYAYDGAGNTANATTAPEGITVDTSPPEFLYVNDTGDWTLDATQLNATWLAQDLESGVRRYFYRIGEDSDNDGIIETFFRYNITDGVWRLASGANTTLWLNVGTNTSMSAAIDNLTNNYTYYIEVKAENWAGVSAFGRSNGILAINESSVTLSVVPNSTYVTTQTVNYTMTCIAMVNCATWVRYNYSSWSLLTVSQSPQNYTMTNDGVYEFVANGTDIVNATKTSPTIWVGRDTVAPNTTVVATNGSADALTAYVNVPIIVNLTAVDVNTYGVNVSGVANITSSFNGSAYSATAGNTTTFNVTSAGTYPLSFYSIDNAGNNESVKNSTILAMENSSIDGASSVTNCTVINSTIINSTLRDCVVLNSNISDAIINRTIVDNSDVELVYTFNATINQSTLETGFVDCLKYDVNYNAPPAELLSNICVAPSRPQGGRGRPAAYFTTETVTVSYIEAGKCTDLAYNYWRYHNIKNIRVCVSRTVANLTIRVSLRETFSPQPLPATYRFVDMFMTNAADEDIMSAAIDFAVQREWILNNSVDYRGVKIYRRFNNSWQQPWTEWTSVDDEYRYYHAVPAGLSLFAIAGPVATCPSTCPPSGLWSSCVNGTANRQEYVCDVDTGFDCGLREATLSCEPGMLCQVCPEPGEWGVCANGMQNRTEYECGSMTNYQCSAIEVAQSCEMPAGCPACPAPGLWSDCVNGTHARQSYRCGPDTSYACVRYTERAGCLTFIVLLTLLGLLLLLIFLIIVVIYKRRAIRRWSRKLGEEAEFTVPKITMPEKPTARRHPIRRWFRRLSEEAELTVPKIRMPESKPVRHVRVDLSVPEIRMPAHRRTEHAARLAMLAKLRKALTQKRVPAKPVVPEVVRAPAPPVRRPERVPQPEPTPMMPVEPERIPVPAPEPEVAGPSLSSIKPCRLHVTDKPRYRCSVCGEHELLIHWCESCGLETCLTHIHKVGTKLYCDNCMKKKKLA